MLEYTQKIKTIIRFENSVNYAFEVNNNISIRNVKHIITAATGYRYNSIKIYSNGAEYTNVDDHLDVLFPDRDVIIFDIKGEKRAEGEDDIEEHVYFNVNKFCEFHNDKFPYFYCFSCKKSICSDCLIQNNHQNHHIVDKHDYLKGSNAIVKAIFEDLNDNIKKALDSEKKIDWDLIRNDLKFKHHPEIIEIVNKIEQKFIESFDIFNKSFRSSYELMKHNSNLLQKHCVSGLDELKKQLHVQDILVDENVFLVFDQKIKELQAEKNRMFNDESKINGFIKNQGDIQNLVEKYYEDLKNTLLGYLNSDVFDKLKFKSTEFQVKEISKEDIYNMLLSDLKKKGSIKTNPTQQPSSLSVVRTLTYDLKVDKDEENLPKYPTPSKTTLTKPKDRKEDESKFTPGINVPASASTIATGQQTGQGLGSAQSVATEVKAKHEISVDDLLMKTIPNTNQIAIYDDQVKSIELNNINISPLILPENKFLKNSAILNIDGSLYISGGDSQNTPTAYFLVYNHLTGELKRLTDMKVERHSHSLYHHGDFIYAVGGYLNNTAERFDLKSHKWEKLSNMIEVERQNPILYVHGNYLYAFFGYKIGSYIDTIERVNTRSNRSKWEFIPIDRDINDLAMIGAGIIESNQDEILFFGGKNSKEEKRTAVHFSFKTHKFEKVQDMLLEDPTYYGESLLKRLSSGSYAQFNLSNNSILKIDMNGTSEI